VGWLSLSGATPQEVLRVAADDKEQALLGILESQFGQRQRALNGLHLDEAAAANTQAEMLRLQRDIQGRFEREQPRRPGRLRDRHPRGVRLAVALSVIAVCAAALLLLVLR
jgi:hypothetical protein